MKLAVCVFFNIIIILFGFWHVFFFYFLDLQDLNSNLSISSVDHELGVVASGGEWEKLMDSLAE